ncbi:MAG: N-acetyl-alpha-D-glucosaminyl L-malate synthase BshA [Flavobacteriaceae bacterium]|nr:MAG: N-acetyl-alpha-D-glucosaminyl L-malate synthase BshA [Flavobacteriaceae bacterium]
MKIGIVCYPTYGGSGIIATELGMMLAKKGHQIHFISYSLPARLDITLPNIVFHQVNVKTYPLFESYQPYSLALSTLMVEIIRNHRLDVLHVHYAIPHAYAAYFAKQILKEENIDIKVITTLHGTDITLVGQNPVYKSAVEFSINQSDAVTTVSQSLKDDTLEVFDIKKEIQVIPNFIDNNLFVHKEGPCPRNNFALPEDKILIHVSNIRKVKRIQDVISVFDKVQKEVPAKLLIVGEGPEAENLQQQVRDLHLEDKVKFMGKINQLHSILCVSDVFLLPSQEESFGLAALEAMAASVPVVSSNAGGITEVNLDGETGFVSNVGDVEKMASDVLSLLKDPEKLAQFKINAQKRALEFDKSKVIPLYEELYQSVIEK